MVAIFGVVTVRLYVDLRAAELAVFAASWAAFYLVEGLVGAACVRRAAVPARADAQQAWVAATRLPVDLLRRWSLYALGAAGAVGAGLVLAALLDLEVYERLLLLPVSLLLYLCSAVLRYVALELSMRPVLEAAAEAPPPGFTWVSLHRRLLATVPMVTWGAAVVVAGLLTENTRELETIALAGLAAAAVTAALSIWLTSCSPTRRVSYRRRSAPWSPGWRSENGCVTRSAPSSIRR